MVPRAGIAALLLLPQLIGTVEVTDDTQGVDENGCPGDGRPSEPDPDPPRLSEPDLGGPGRRVPDKRTHRYRLDPAETRDVFAAMRSFVIAAREVT